MKTAPSVLKTLMLTAVLLILGLGQSSAAEKLKPFILAYTTNADMGAVVTKIKEKLTAGGFDIVGSYAPYTNAKFSNGELVSAEVIGVTDDAIQQAAAQTDFGGFAVVQRVTVTKVVKNGTTQVQVAYTNPVYMANAYHLNSDMSDVATQFQKALGNEQQYGPDSGLSPSDLRDYHYKWLMPYFGDRWDLAKYASYQEALTAVNAGLAAHKGGTSKVYEVAIPGKDVTLFGVALAGPKNNSCSGDEYVMSQIDFKDLKSTGHLPYGILVRGNQVYALRAKFRIAINFPDLSMMGSNSFMSIMCAPGSIEKALKEVVSST